MNERLVLVVDQTSARIFSASGRPATLTPVLDLVNKEGRLKDSELGTDKPGRMFDGGRPNKSGFDPATTFKEESVSHFLRQVVSEVWDRTKLKHVDLTVVAGPKILGALRPELDRLSSVNVVEEIHRDLSESKPEEIAQYLGSGA